MLERTIEDYCRAIDKMDSGDGVRSVDLTRMLGLSKNTVALTLQKLAAAGLVEMEKYGKVRLSGNGAKIARRMNFKHRVIETFLFSKLNMEKERVHGEACALEHWASDDMIERLYEFIGRPKTDPHGKAIV
ncbi:MAG TPA: metal-dependent transcriptional regulator [Candidatus Bilamarchaeum sp.]|nr:metal-dependent transcriptional regulator [Candidatus Bilamarchaeum sp.]